MFTAALFLIGQNWKKLKRMVKQTVIQSYDGTLLNHKKKKTTSWMDFKGITLNEKSISNVTYYLIPFT